VFNRVERTVGTPLEQLIDTRRFADVLVLAFRAQGVAYRLAERQTRAVLHVLNIPSRTDVRQINRQLTVLATEIRRVSDLLDRPAVKQSGKIPVRSTQRSTAAKTPAQHG
jgi:hypothetical protein